MTQHSKEDLYFSLIDLMCGSSNAAKQICIQLYDTDAPSVLALYRLRLTPYEIIIMYSYVCFEEIKLMVKALDTASQNESYRKLLVDYIGRLYTDFQKLEASRS